MGMRVQPGVIGCTIRPVIASRDRSLEEMIYDTAQLALADAGITIDDIDGIVVAVERPVRRTLDFRDDGIGSRRRR